MASVRNGQVFTLQCPMGHPHGDPVFPGREGIKREMVWDQELFESGNGPSFPGGIRASDDKAEIFLQGSSQYDALGHAWYDDTLWNGRSADTTNGGGMSWASILPIAERGVVGRGVLIDMARHRGKEWLDKGETFTHTDLEEAAAEQGTSIEDRDILCVRTGFLKYFYATPAEEFYEGFIEPGLTYSRELVEWFQRKEIPNLVTDTIANEVTGEPRDRGAAAAARVAAAQPRGQPGRDHLARRPRRRLRRRRSLGLPLHRGAAEDPRGDRRPRQPGGDPLMS